MSNQAKRLSDCPAERLAHCRGEAVPPAGDVEVQRYHVQLFRLSGEQQKYAHGALGAVQVVRASEFDRAAAEVSALQLRLNIADQRVCDLEVALGGMLFAFDDGVGRDWSSPLLDHARKLCKAVEFKSAPVALHKENLTSQEV